MSEAEIESLTAIEPAMSSENPSIKQENPHQEEKAISEEDLAQLTSIQEAIAQQAARNQVPLEESYQPEAPKPKKKNVLQKIGRIIRNILHYVTLGLVKKAT